MQTLCTICQDVFLLDDFLFLPCGLSPLCLAFLKEQIGKQGHGFCASCIQSFSKPRCPVCRGTAVGARRIYVHSPDSATSIGDSISALEHGASVRVDKLSSRIRNHAVDSGDLDIQVFIYSFCSSEQTYHDKSTRINSSKLHLPLKPSWVHYATR